MFNNLIEVILSKVEEEKHGVYFIRSEKEEKFISYKELYQKAWKLKEYMRANGIMEKQEVILQLDDNEPFVISFWACILGKMIPVPLCAQRGKQSVNQVLKVYQQLENPYIIASEARYEELSEYSMQTILYSETYENIQFYHQKLACNPDDTAFLQFSSGSTGVPKGIMISHNNLMQNFVGMTASSEIRKDDSMLSWMPLYHNLGLIVSHLLGIACNIDSYLMSTELFIYHPYIWMDKVSEHKVTLTCSPNFGYRYYLRGMMDRDCSRLDLSHLRIILNGAEPISLQACKTFLEMMKPYGLKEEVFQTGYGLAEATVSVTSTYVGRDLEVVTISGENQTIGSKVKFVSDHEQDQFAVDLVKVGRPHFNNSIRVVDDEGQPLEDGYFGQVQVKGACVAKGYHQKLGQNMSLPVHDGWLDTGDIGFIVDGQLIISGRKKDIIIVNGKNYYCHDLESVIREKYPNCECAVCGIYQNELERDQIVLFMVKGDNSYIELRNYGDNLKRHLVKRIGVVIDKVVVVSELPKTGSGKIQRFQLREYLNKGLCEDLYKQYTRRQAVEIIQEQVKKVLGFTMEDLDESIVEAGMNSLKAATFQKYLFQAFQTDIPVSIVFDYPSVNAIADYILGDTDGEQEPKEEKGIQEDIAVIGMACQFPNGADTVESYWEKLIQNYDGITEIPEDREELREYFDSTNTKMYGGFLSSIDQFDAGLFGITPKEAKYLDPQQRLLLLNAYRALDDACLDIKRLRGSRTGVFVGVSNSDYKEIMPKHEAIAYMLSGNMNNMAAGRISYTFDFHGPSLVIDTACSSSLVAVHQAVISLRAGESDMALAGGVNCILSPLGYQGLQAMNAISPTGRCHSFDDSADGYVRGEGCGIVVLKRYEDAKKAGDRIYAVIKGSAANSDGWSSGLTAPNGTAQVRVMKQALLDAHVKPTNISYIETHGTGTRLGDPQEVNALNQVYGKRSSPLLLGAVKTNVGHLESAAGIASFIKVVLSIYNGKIPPNHGFQKANHLIPWDKMHFQIPTENVEWTGDARTAGVSAFGLSGTNVHLILQQNVTEVKEFEEGTPDILTISARNRELLIKELDQMTNFLANNTAPLESVLYTMNRCRSNDRYRIGIAARNRQEYVECLKKRVAKGKEAIQRELPMDRKILLLCGGIQQLNRKEASALYNGNAVYKKAFDECAVLLEKEYHFDILAWMNGTKEIGKTQELYGKMSMEYGIYKALQYFGVKVDRVMGHQDGEWIGAVIAGILTLRQAFVYATAMQQVKEEHGVPRKAAIVFISEMDWKQHMGVEDRSDCFLVSINTKDSIVIGYESDDVLDMLKEQNIAYRELADKEVSWIEDKQGAKNEFLDKVKYEKVANGWVTYISTASDHGNDMVDDGAKLFASKIDGPTNVLHALRESQRMEASIYLECNVTPSLSALAAQELPEDKVILPAIRRKGNEEIQLRDTVAKMYELGIDIHFSFQEAHGNWLVKLPERKLKQQSFWFSK